MKEEVGKVERPKKTKVKVEKPKASGSKPTTRRRAPPKSAAVVEFSSGEKFEEMDEDEEMDEEPKPKRARGRARAEIHAGKYKSNNLVYIFL